MRAYATFLVAVLCATCVGAAVASQPVSTAGAKRAAVRVLSCDRSDQEALFRGSMRRVGGTGRMSMRFTLLQRDPGERFRRVRAPRLSRWKRSRYGVLRFAHRQRVRGLREGLGERYFLSVKNAGEMDAPESGLRLGVDGNAPRFASVPGLAPGETATVSVVGARCVYRVRAAADPEQQIPESREGDNTLAHGCP